MKVLAVFVAVACIAQSALCGWAPAYYGGHGAYAHGGYAPTGGYHGPLAAPVVTPSGFLADTPEVAAAKAAHFSEVAKASTHAAAAPAHGYAGAGYAGYAGGYHGPYAAPVVTPSGFLADTPEVAAAKAAHLSLVAKAGGHAGYAGHYAAPYAAPYAAGHYDDGSYKGEGAYSGHWDEASHYDDGSYKPHLYEHGHY